MNQKKAFRHVKIVCTLGPASSSPETIQEMLNAGMDIARLNLSYGTIEEHSRLILRSGCSVEI